MDEIEFTFDHIVSNPFLYQEVEPDIRRAVAHTFPYLVFYTFDVKTAQILAVIHGAQDPAYVNERLAPKALQTRTRANWLPFAFAKASLPLPLSFNV